MRSGGAKEFLPSYEQSLILVHSLVLESPTDDMKATKLSPNIDEAEAG